MYKRFKLSIQKAMDRTFSWLLWKMSEEARLQVFRMSGRVLGVRSCTCNGTLGTYEGGINDQSVLACYLFTGNYEPALQALLADYIFINGHGTFVDIGANIGLTMIPVARERGISCFGFEPDPDNYTFLRKNIVGNGVESRVTAFNFALFSKNGKLDFELSDTNMGDHRIRRKSPSAIKNNAFDEQFRRVITTKARKLDNVLNVNSLDRPVAVKIDTQGSEVQVFKGARVFLQGIDYMIVEYWPYGVRRIGDLPDAFIETVKQFPYGAICDRQSPDVSVRAPKLESISNVIKKMRDIAQDESGTTDMNIILSRHPKFST
ncbi:MAG: hypothetical protein BBJ57_02500 [Desulfobacterales bacterium PC51MH44]|nr:MAG: hypothetical protein BBJ57_02500 [Desulfobacterales bacterium PC51MH44]